MGLPYDREAYERRYAKVYAAGARFWEDPRPTEELAAFIQEMSPPKSLDVIELGCGEGRDAIFIAKQGHRVTAIDAAPSAINRAIEWAAKERVHVDFQVGDVVDLRSLADASYDLAVNIGCLHMIVNEDARLRHLKEALRVLRPKGIYFSCNIGGDKPLGISDLSQAMPRPGSLIPRKIKVNGAETEIMLPVIAAWPRSGEQYRAEFENAGYRILKRYKRITRALGSCWVVIAQKAYL